MEVRNKMEQKIQVIEDWIDLFLIIGLCFMLMVLGVWVLPQLPTKVHLLFALSILFTSLYFVRRILNYFISKFDGETI